MDYPTAIERACKRAHETADEQARNHNYGGAYLKHLATAKFFEVVAEEDVDLGGRGIGEIGVDLLRGVNAVKEAAAAAE